MKIGRLFQYIFTVIAAEDEDVRLEPQFMNVKAYYSKKEKMLTLTLFRWSVLYEMAEISLLGLVRTEAAIVGEGSAYSLYKPSAYTLYVANKDNYNGANVARKVHKYFQELVNESVDQIHYTGALADDIVTKVSPGRSYFVVKMEIGEEDMENIFEEGDDVTHFSMFYYGQGNKIAMIDYKVLDKEIIHMDDCFILDIEKLIEMIVLINLGLFLTMNIVLYIKKKKQDAELMEKFNE
ncbi:hypothetical protein ECANGB1_2253 [Enterospora canceri]|uniref:Uncharacterized protein n=1 Tax=Enterospora canceri TaxID=1081671 RepID=A0A1Y1S4U6_9MICR|nr:hypothetical protein ECANGB1_2253 [Enterospora canceri]